MIKNSKKGKWNKGLLELPTSKETNTQNIIFMLEHSTNPKLSSYKPKQINLDPDDDIYGDNQW